MSTAIDAAFSAGGWVPAPASAFAGSTARAGQITATVGVSDPGEIGRALAAKIGDSAQWSAIVTVDSDGPDVTLRVTAADLREPSGAGAGGGDDTSDYTRWSGNGLTAYISNDFSARNIAAIEQILARYGGAYSKARCTPTLRIERRVMSGTRGLYSSRTIWLEPNRGVNGDTLAHELTHFVELTCGLPASVKRAFMDAQGLSGDWAGAGHRWRDRPQEIWAEAGMALLYGHPSMAIRSEALRIVRDWLGGTGLAVHGSSGDGTHPASTGQVGGMDAAGTTTGPWDMPGHAWMLLRCARAGGNAAGATTAEIRAILKREVPAGESGGEISPRAGWWLLITANGDTFGSVYVRGGAVRIAL